ncbi:hypothetical protein [Parvibaculum sp.]|uniref:hypothetical protein n=1 Tax=Parvibaculum sp. TaxID=2024848 RepID=UPI000C61CA63|nr:hypothetical protein [Parvibaculum sp.]HAC59353.1 hypothetical protein [Rhodobiaceae bacterium]MAU60275.1 hypothetical protein [Parvibaculum sp.]MBO6669487.1 hypothetical protein [Parvibaculum sp.]MBO6692213.1 hypothetical protein [Parvibaculum sp.]MBO6715873.1 hypothetical protein [Parvibaculum sp.]
MNMKSATAFSAVFPFLRRVRQQGANEREEVRPVLLPLWVASGIASSAFLFSFYGDDGSVLPALIFLTVCPLLVAAVLLMEGEDSHSDS